MIEWLCREILGIGAVLSPEEERIAKKIKEKNDELAKYGGRMEVVGRGSLTHKFDTEEGENQYWAMVRRKQEQKCREAGFEDIEDFMNKWNNR